MKCATQLLECPQKLKGKSLLSSDKPEKVNTPSSLYVISFLIQFTLTRHFNMSEKKILVGKVVQLYEAFFAKEVGHLRFWLAKLRLSTMFCCLRTRMSESWLMPDCFSYYSTNIAYGTVVCETRLLGRVLFVEGEHLTTHPQLDNGYFPAKQVSPRISCCRLYTKRIACKARTEA